MSIIVDIGGVNYSVPETGQRGWGQDTTDLLVALSDASYLIRGGSIPLVSEADFGPTAGLKSVWFASRSGNEASTGVVRLSNLDEVNWRNAANDGDNVLTVDASDKLTYNGTDVALTTDIPVDSVFGRTGVVVADTNDYTWAQIDKTTSDLADITTKSHTSLTDVGTNTHAQIDTHIANVTTNPHAVDQTDVGLGNVDNTSDATKNAAVATLTNKTIDADNNTISNIGTDELSDDGVTSAKLEHDIVLPGTGATTLPSGTDAQKPAGSAGQLRFNTDEDTFEGHDGTVWGPIGGGGGLALTQISTTGTAEIGKHYLTDSSAAGFTITLPDPTGFSAAELEQAVIVVQDSTLDTGTEGLEVTVAPHSGGVIATNRGIQAVDETLVQDKAGWAVEYVWDNDASHWKAQDYLGAQGTGTTEIKIPKVTAWQSYTPSNVQGFGTITSRLQWRQSGENIEITGDFTCGTVPSSTTAQLELPSGYTMSYQDSTANVKSGTLERSGSTGLRAHIVLGRDGRTYVQFGRKADGVSTDALLAADSDTLVSTGTRVAVDFSVPVAELAGDNAYNIIDVAQLEAAASAGGKNYILNPSASTSTDDVTPDAGFSVTRTTTESELAEPSVGTGFKISGSGLTAGTSKVAWPILATGIDDADGGRFGTARVAVKDISGTVNGEYSIQVYDVDNSVYVGDEETITGTGTYYLDVPLTGEGDYEFHLIAQAVAPSNIGISSVTIEPVSQTTAGVIGKWQSYTPSNTQGLGTITNVELEWRSVGQSVEVRGYFTSGTVSAVEAQFELPNSYTISQSGTSRVLVGEMKRASTQSIRDYTILATNGETYVNFGRQVESASINPLSEITGDLALTSTTRASLYFSVPVAELANAYTPTASDVQYENASSEYELTDGATVSTGTYQLVKYQTKLNDTATDYDTTTGVWTCPATGRYQFDIKLSYTSSVSGLAGIVIKKGDQGTGFTGTISSNFIEDTQYPFCSDTLLLTKGDEISFHAYQSSGGNKTVDSSAGNVSFNRFAINRISDYSARKASLPFAGQNGEYGLVKEWYEEKALDNEFTAGTLIMSRVDQQVSIGLKGAGLATHASLSDVETSAGFVPEEYRPAQDTYNAYLLAATVVAYCRVESDGTFRVNYRDWAGSAINLTSTVSNTIISYPVQK